MGPAIRPYGAFVAEREVVDARRLLCPMPVIRTQERIKRMSTGDELEVLCTDPGAANDIPAWCRLSGHEVLAVEARDWEVTISIRVGRRDGHD